MRIDCQTAFQAFDFLETLRTPQGLSGESYDEAIPGALFLQMLDALVDWGESSLEVIYHPAFIDDIIRQGAYCYPHLTELDVLASPSPKYAVAERGYRLSNFLNV